MGSLIARLRTEIGFGVEEVALMAGWSVAHQHAIEAGEELLAEEADKLTALLGADVEADVEPTNRPLRALLKSQSQQLDARARFSLAEATTVAREIQELRALLDQPCGLGEVRGFVGDGDYGHPRDGVPERLAQSVRQHLDLGSEAISSMQRDILDPLGIIVLWSDLPREIDALAFASEETGAVIVANPNGQHMTTAFGRRIAFAHEVCHLLFDRHEMTRFVRACRIERGLVGTHIERFDRIERRARAFALYLLAPTTAMNTRWIASEDQPIAERVLDIMNTFGIGYEATRSHLANVNCLHFDIEINGVSTRPDLVWEASDPVPAQSIPPSAWLRSGVLASTADEAMVAGRISARRADELVRGPLRPPEAWSPVASTKGYRTTSMGVEPGQAAS